VTHRSLASGFAVVTGHKASGDEVKWGDLARSVDTLVIVMGLHNLDAIMAKLLAGGCEPQRPVALVQSGTSNEQRVLGGTVATIGALAANANFRSPALIVVGETVRLRKQLRWFDTGMVGMRSLAQHVENNGAVLI
jgi:siroheme synthase